MCVEDTAHTGWEGCVHHTTGVLIPAHKPHIKAGSSSKMWVTWSLMTKHSKVYAELQARPSKDRATRHMHTCPCSKHTWCKQASSRSCCTGCMTYSKHTDEWNALSTNSGPASFQAPTPTAGLHRLKAWPKKLDDCQRKVQAWEAVLTLEKKANRRAVNRGVSRSSCIARTTAMALARKVGRLPDAWKVIGNALSGK